MQSVLKISIPWPCRGREGAHWVTEDSTLGSGSGFCLRPASPLLCDLGRSILFLWTSKMPPLLRSSCKLFLCAKQTNGVSSVWVECWAHQRSIQNVLPAAHSFLSFLSFSLPSFLSFSLSPFLSFFLSFLSLFLSTSYFKSLRLIISCKNSIEFLCTLCSVSSNDNILHKHSTL